MVVYHYPPAVAGNSAVVADRSAVVLVAEQVQTAVSASAQSDKAERG